MSSVEQIDIEKGGETVISIGTSRDIEGIRVTVKVVPLIEEFFRHWAIDQKIDMSVSLGRLWIPKSGALTAWMLPDGTISYENPYDLNSLGSSLLSEPINLSFLRLVGASGPEGVTFVSEEVASREQHDRLNDRITRMAARFFTDYLKPVKAQITVSSYTKI